MRTTLIAGFSAALLIGGCATNTQTGKSTNHDESVCEMPAIEGTPTVAKSFAKFGEEQKLAAADTVPVSSVLASPDQYEGKYVRMSGVVTAVCPKKGCWMRVASADAKPGDANVFIKFPDPPEGMYIPLEAVGHTTTIEGTVKNGTMSEAAARHFKQDAGASADEIAQVVGDQKQVMIAKPAVTIEGVGKAN